MTYATPPVSPDKDEHNTAFALLVNFLDKTGINNRNGENTSINKTLLSTYIIDSFCCVTHITKIQTAITIESSISNL